jgi:nucleotide-binding universal stress UspA family protein
MRSYRRILGLIDISANGEKVARRALQMAQLYNATLGTATVVDYTPGYESGHAPFLTPQQAQDAVVKDFSRKLDHLLDRIGGSGVEGIVAAGHVKSSVRDILQSWDPDLVIVGSHEPYGLDQPKSMLTKRGDALPFDILVVQMEPPKHFGGRFVRALATAF